MSETAREVPRQLDFFSAEPEAPVHPPRGVAVDLGFRALQLSRALTMYSQGSRSAGFDVARRYDDGIHKRYTSGQRERIVSAARAANKEAYDSFVLASGAQAMIAAGFDEAVVHETVREENRDFVNKYVGPQNKARREKLRRQLKKQLAKK
jgi:hypothetical protein